MRVHASFYFLFGVMCDRLEVLKIVAALVVCTRIETQVVGRDHTAAVLG